MKKRMLNEDYENAGMDAELDKRIKSSPAMRKAMKAAKGVAKSSTVKTPNKK